MVRCMDCERVYAAYYNDEDNIVTPAGECCPNCDGATFTDVSELGRSSVSETV
jgi:hypothetical protein